MGNGRDRMLWPAAVLTVSQVVHAAVPVDENKPESESWVGPVVGLAFLALSVIPKLKITDRGLIDVDEFEVSPLFAD